MLESKFSCKELFWYFSGWSGRVRSTGTVIIELTQLNFNWNCQLELGLGLGQWFRGLHVAHSVSCNKANIAWFTSLRGSILSTYWSAQACATITYLEAYMPRAPYCRQSSAKCAGLCRDFAQDSGRLPFKAKSAVIFHLQTHLSLSFISKTIEVVFHS